MQALLSHLNKEEQYYQCLVQLQEDMQNCLVQNRQAELDKVIQQHEQCLNLMQAQEKERVQLMQPLGSNLESILEKLSDLRERTQLKSLQEKINAHITRLRHLSHLNQALLEQGQAYIQHTTELYRSLARASSPAVYSPYGQLEAPAEPARSFCEFDA